MKTTSCKAWFSIGLLSLLHVGSTFADLSGSVELGGVYNRHFSSYLNQDFLSRVTPQPSDSETISTQSFSLGYSISLDQHWLLRFQTAAQHVEFTNNKQIYSVLSNNGYLISAAANYRYDRRNKQIVSAGKRNTDYNESKVELPSNELLVQDSSSIFYKIELKQRLSFRTWLSEKLTTERNQFEDVNIRVRNTDNTLSNGFSLAVNWRASKNLYTLFSAGASRMDFNNTDNLSRDRLHLNMGVNYKISSSVYFRSLFSRQKNTDNDDNPVTNQITTYISSASVAIGYNF
jgi:hypothetical protein